VAIMTMTGGQRFATAVVTGLVAVLALTALTDSFTARSALNFCVDDLSTRSPAPIDREVIVTGSCVVTMPSDRGQVVVVLCGGVGRADCHFEIPVADRSRLERRLAGAGDVVIRGRCERVTAGIAVLRDCQLLDSPPSAE